MARVVDSVKTKRLIVSAEAVCEANGRSRINGNVASEGTFRSHMNVVKNFCRTLHRQGLMIENVNSIGEKHINAVFDAWVEKGLKPKTLQGLKSEIKGMMTWLRKPGLADYIEQIEGRYADGSFRVKTVAVTSKSERGAGVDLEMVYLRARAVEPRFEAMLMVERVFGLRKKEAILVKPHISMKRGVLLIDGNIAKNGRPRDIAFARGPFGQYQRDVLTYACKQCEPGESLGWQDRSYDSCVSLYYRRCKQIGLTKSALGITGHSLRAGFAEDMALLDRILPPVLGGTKEMSRRDVRQISKSKTSELMGHSRTVVTHAYYGQDKRLAKASDILGFEFAPAIKLSEKDRAVLWVSERPTPVAGRPGEFEFSEVAAQLAFVTVQIISGETEVSRMSIDQFLAMYPMVEELLDARLRKIGLTLSSGEGH